MTMTEKISKHGRILNNFISIKSGKHFGAEDWVKELFNFILYILLAFFTVRRQLKYTLNIF